MFIKIVINLIIITLAILSLYCGGNLFNDGYNLTRIIPKSQAGWQQVNSNGFGDSKNIASFGNSTVFKGYLYIPVYNIDNDTAQIWRTFNGNTWEKVVSDSFGVPNSNICSLFPYKDYLYAGTSNSNGGEIWRTSDGSSWEPVVGSVPASIGKGFGNTDNKTISGFGLETQVHSTIYDYHLVASTENSLGTELWYTTDGTNWTIFMANNGFGDSNNSLVKPMIMFFPEGFLAGTDNTNTGAEIWYTLNCTTWSQIGGDGLGYSDNTNVSSLAIFNNNLYAGTENVTNGAELHRIYKTTTWERANTDGFGDTNNYNIRNIINFYGELYTTVDNDINGCETWRSSDGTNWAMLTEWGFGDKNNTRAMTASIFKGDLYISTYNDVTGTEIWKYTTNSVPIQIVDDFETGFLHDWIIESSQTRNAMTLPAVINQQLHLGPYSGRFFLHVGTIAEAPGTGTVSLYKNIVVPTNATSLTYYYDHSSDDLGYGYSRAYIADGATIVEDTGWVKPDASHNVKVGLYEWKPNSFDVTALQGKTIKIWFGVNDDGNSFSGCEIYVDMIYFE